MLLQLFYKKCPCCGEKLAKDEELPMFRCSLCKTEVWPGEEVEKEADPFECDYKKLMMPGLPFSHKSSSRNKRGRKSGKVSKGYKNLTEV